MSEPSLEDFPTLCHDNCICSDEDWCVQRLAKAEIERLRVALKPFAECAPEDANEIDYLVDCRDAVANARSAYQQQAQQEK